MEISLIEFTDIVKKLHENFGKNSHNELIEGQIASWHERWNKNFPKKTSHHLKAAIDFAIDNCERFPAWAEFRTIVGNIKDPVIQATPQQDCSFCFGIGSVIAFKAQGMHLEKPLVYENCFRCPECKGPNLSEYIPMWSDWKEQDGYKLHSHYAKEPVYVTEI